MCVGVGDAPCSFLFSNVLFFWGTHRPCPDITRWTAFTLLYIGQANYAESIQPSTQSGQCVSSCRLDGEAEACTPAKPAQPTLASIIVKESPQSR